MRSQLMASRRGMTLVRLRDGVFPSGQSVPADHPGKGFDRPVHIVVKDLGPEPGMWGVEPLVSCCGWVFEPGTLELVAWGTVLPHEVCVLKTGVPRTFVSRVYREARDSLLRSEASEEDVGASIASVEKMLANRGPDWVRDVGSDVWTYEGSFNGVFSKERIYPRGLDIGLSRLVVQVPYPGTVHIHSCGLLDGCPRHTVRTETLSLDDLGSLERRVSSHEIAASSIVLMDLAWCLLTGTCSTILIPELNEPISGCRRSGGVS